MRELLFILEQFANEFNSVAKLLLLVGLGCR